MIRVLLLSAHRETIDTYLQTWARSLDGHLRSVPYESLPPDAALHSGVFIFSDLDRLTDAQCRRADTLAELIEEAGARVLNRPSRVICRHALLRSLHDSGSNPFNVYREAELNGQLRYPVFIRREHEHNGTLTRLLRTSGELQRAITQLKQHPQCRDDLLIVEFIETAAPDGLYRKYSAMRIGDHLIPRHVLFSKSWLNKTPDVVTPDAIAEEETFLRDFPHADQVRGVFNTAGIEYGRIDYSLLNGKLIVWEINTNPVILPFPENCEVPRLAGQGQSAKLIHAAWLELAKAKDVSIRFSGCPNVMGDSAAAPA